MSNHNTATQPTRRGSAWRYQPVYTVHDGERTFTVIEVYLHPDGTLDGWTEKPAMIPQGRDSEELSQDLIRMLADTWKWRPVAYDDLRAGMAFERTGVNIDGMIAAMNMARSSLA